jgi:hypothetical protein
MILTDHSGSGIWIIIFLEEDMFLLKGFHLVFQDFQKRFASVGDRNILLSLTGVINR